MEITLICYDSKKNVSIKVLKNVLRFESKKQEEVTVFYGIDDSIFGPVSSTYTGVVQMFLR